MVLILQLAAMERKLSPLCKGESRERRSHVHGAHAAAATAPAFLALRPLPSDYDFVCTTTPCRSTVGKG